MGVAAREPLLERDEELAALVELLDRARGGEGRVVLLEGPAGIGKTRLLRATRDSAKEAGIRVLSARATELERDFPFALVHQLFEPALHAVEPSERDKLLADAARPAAPVVGVETSEVHPGTEDAVADPSFATLNALYWLTSNLAESAPLMLAVDDAHWADKASLRYLRFLAPRLEDLPVLLALAARPAEAGADSELLDQLVADPLARVLRPHALSPRAVAELVRSQLSSDAVDEFCAASHQATAGNPFMLRELLVELVAQGSTGTAAEAHHVRELAPSTIQRAVLLRLARLPGAAPRLARAVAVLGDDAEPAQAAALAELEPHAAADAADALAAAGILESGRPLRFVHPLVRNVIYADLASSDRSAAHRAAARLLRADVAEPERIALHLLATDPDRDSAVVETLSTAARRALDRGAPEAAISYLRRALAEPPDDRRRRDLLGLLATASLITMDRDALEDPELDLVEELSADAQTLMTSASVLSPLLFAWGRAEESRALLERSIEAAIAAEDFDLVMRMEAQLVMWAHLPPGKQRARWDRYEGRIAHDTPAKRIWLALRAMSATFAGEPAATAAELARRALGAGAIFGEQPDGVVSAIPLYVLVRADQLDVAERAIEQYRSEAQGRGATGVLNGAAYLRGELACARGDISRAEPDVRVAVEAARQGGFPLAFPNWVAALIDVLIERGELDAAEHELRASGMDGDIPDDFWFIPLLASRAPLRLAQGKTAEGLEDVFELVRRGERDGITNRALSPTAALAAVALAGSSELEAARAFAEAYLAGAREWGTPRAIGIGLRARGVVEGGEKGIGLLHKAVATLEGSPARLEHAKALTDLGAALRRGNRRAEAREPLRQALEIARPRGALAVARRAHEELEATGEKLGPLLAGGVEALTPSERRIAGLAADGLTNRQIAQTLFLSVKTVESHLGGAYRKLDIGSRGELGTVLASASDS